MTASVNVSAPDGALIALELGALHIVEGAAAAWLAGLGASRLEADELPGLVDGAPRAPQALSVERAVGYAADLLLDALEVGARRERLKAALGACGLAELLSVRVGALGEEDRLRVALAIELLRRPALLVFTPPASAALLETLADAAEQGVAVICAASEAAARPAGARSVKLSP
jgi:ABC-type multidrug transport system ATPase subunit